MSTSRRTSKTAPREVVPIDTVIPYWRNPRRITEETVTAVAESIARYGYTQPIVVDEANTIIVGHTRYAALRKLGATSIEVEKRTDLTTEQSKALRVLDNKTHEFTSWDYDNLMGELGDLDADLMRSYFPEVGADPDAMTAPAPAPAESFDESSVAPTADFVCPDCYHSFTLQVTIDQINKGKLEVVR